jgi:Sulfotransferase family
VSFYQITRSAAEFIAEARAQTGIRDIVDSDIEAPLHQLLLSLNTEAQLNKSGVEGMEALIKRVLRNRLRMQRDLRNHPEILEQKIERPLILTGAGRTGSTKLHKMLCASGDFLFLVAWQGLSIGLISGERGEDPAERIREAEEKVRWFCQYAPESRLIHELSTFEPDEENLIMEQQLYATYFMPFVNVPGYMNWYWQNKTFLGEVQFIRQVLQYLQWQFHDGDPRHWLLKNPGYPGYEAVLREVFPDATFVTTNRDPVSVVSSGASLVKSFHAACSDVDYDALLGQAMIEGFRLTWAGHIAVRDSHPEIQFLDIGYTELTAHADRVVEKIYAHIGKPLSDRARLAMHRWDRDNTQYKKGVHRHLLERFGVTPEMVRDKLGFYIERFRDYF